MKKRPAAAPRLHARSTDRIHCLREIALSYEGQSELTLVKSPDLSARGMFISTTRPFPEGAILNLRFRLALTSAEVRTRAEVRYCLPDVGVGVEFIGLEREAKLAIAKELAVNNPRRAVRTRKSRPRRKR